MAAAVVKPWWRETIETILWALVLALILRTFVVQAFWIPSGSMVPTLLPGDRVLVAKFWYWFQEPKRGQIMVFKYPVDPQRDFVKRIVGLPGDVIEIRDGIVSVNGAPIAEPYIRNHDLFTLTEGPVFPKVPLTVPKGSYFVMGDNRPNSQDSRFWGVVPKQNVRGPAFIRYWPLDRVGLLD
jgi:signal peptidase I